MKVGLGESAVKVSPTDVWGPVKAPYGPIWAYWGFFLAPLGHILGVYWAYEGPMMGPFGAHPWAHDGPMFGLIMDPFGPINGPIIGYIMAQAMVAEETLTVILGGL
jgi:hypothetical protein